MSWYDMFRVGKYKRELAEQRAQNVVLKSELDALKNQCGTLNKQHKALQARFGELLDTYQKLLARAKVMNKQVGILKSMEAIGLHEAVEQLRNEKVELDLEIEHLRDDVDSRKSEIIQLDEVILLQSFGIYETRYNLEDSQAYKRKLDDIRSRQKAMVKDGTAAVGSTNWVINNSETEGRKMIKDYVKLIVRSFNNECDATIIKATHRNIASLEKKINKAASTLNKLGDRMSISITAEYVNLKLEELYLSYEYQQKLQDEKEEQRLIKEKMREDAKLLREIEKAREKLRKEATHFQNAIQVLDTQLEQAETEEERELIVAEKQKVEAELEKVNDDIVNNEAREQNTAGYVYVISNIGSFGDDVYKIGMTRRLDPQERVDELGDASVPYRFDVHAMIFSEDAPSLETALHQAFEHRRMNLVNRRREFFQVNLEEIEQVVKQNFKKPFEFTMTAAAPEYRESIRMRDLISQVVA